MKIVRNLRKNRRGKVISNRADKTITVAIERKVKHPLYGKYIRKVTKIMAHDEENSAQIGDFVHVMETRPLSKKKCWRLTEIINTRK